MKTYKCSRHKDVKVPSLSKKEKIEILNKREELGTLRTTKFLRETYEMELGEAKNFIHHINSKKGKCLVCKVDSMEGENQTCPNCGRFSLNWDIEKLLNIKEL